MSKTTGANNYIPAYFHKIFNNHCYMIMRHFVKKSDYTIKANIQIKVAVGTKIVRS